MIKSDIVHQELITKEMIPTWKKIFSSREYDYLTHIINGLILYSDKQLSSIMIQYGKKEPYKILHIIEPFHTLNCLGYNTYSVVSIIFSATNNLQFWIGYDNGLTIFHPQLELKTISSYPKINLFKTDFWHFVKAIEWIDESKHEYTIH